MSAIPSLYSSGLSALRANQSALSVTGNNIANVNTEGYSRQRVDFTQKDTIHNSNAGFIGGGVDSGRVIRIYDTFINRQLGESNSSHSHFDRLHEYSLQLDGLVADPEAGLTPALGAFFNAVNDVANRPASIPARQVLLNESESLAGRFRMMNSRMDELRKQSEMELANLANEVNGISRAIAEINLDIVALTAQGEGATPNDLMDQRERLLQELSRLVRVNTMQQGNGSIHVMIGSGHSLISGGQFSELTLVNGEFGAGDPHLLLSTPGLQGGGTDLAGMVKGGKIGGILEFVDTVLQPAQGRFGAIAATVATMVNEQHRGGFGLDGSTGKELFSIDPGEALGGSGNSNSGASIALSIDPENVSDITADRHQLERISAAEYRITNLSRGTFSIETEIPATLGGVTLTVTGEMATGDRFLIQPMSGVAATMRTAITDVREIAASATGKSGDNGNMLSIAQLQGSRQMLGGEGGPTATFQDAYGQMVSEVGVKSHYAEINRTAQESILNQAQARRDSLSAVNLDEEAANLMKFQQAYQASARMVAMADDLFNSIMSAVS